MNLAKYHRNRASKFLAWGVLSILIGISSGAWSYVIGRDDPYSWVVGLIGPLLGMLLILVGLCLFRDAFAAWMDAHKADRIEYLRTPRPRL